MKTAELLFAIIGAWFTLGIVAGAAWVIIRAAVRRRPL